MTVSPRVEQLNPPEDADETEFDPIVYIASLVFGLVYIMAGAGYGSTIAQNTVVEKQTRTVELLVSAVPANSLLAGKILGNSFLAITQVVAIVGVSVLGLVGLGQTSLLSTVSAPALWFVAFFIVGFVLIAAIFAASASLVSRIEDTGSVLTPVIMLTMLPYFAVVFLGSNPDAIAIASFVPFTSTVAMPARMLTEALPWWQPVGSLLLLALTAAAVIWIAARIYNVSVLKMGPRLKLKDALAKDS